MKRFDCSTCKRGVSFEGPLPALYPFCSERCRMVDLGLWLTESYSIDRGLTPEEIAAMRVSNSDMGPHDFDDVARIG